MPGVLPAPSATAGAEDHADWLELRALLADDRSSSLADLGRAIRPNGTIEEVIEEQVGDELPSELVDPGSDFLERVVDAASSELDDRAAACGDGYPFVRGDQYLEAIDGAPRSVYAFLLLLATAGVSAGPEGLETEKLFEDLSADAGADYFGGPPNNVFVYPFGFPRRRTVAGFQPAIRDLVRLLGEGGGPRARPTTRDQKDAKLDLVVWRPFTDERYGKIIAFGQCAAGRNWREKLTELQPIAFSKNWLTGPLSMDPLRMFFCPFRVDRRRWETTVNEAGILFDRCRIAAHTSHLGDDLLDQCETFSRHVLGGVVARA
jgi:hypothetical protein